MAFLMAGVWAKTAAAKEPSMFLADPDNRGFEHAEKPSDAVLDALLKTPQAKEKAESLQKPGREGQRAEFSAVSVHLAGADEKGWVVRGSLLMSGDYNDWYWLVREHGTEAEILLFANGYQLNLKRSKSHGYRNVVCVWGFETGDIMTRKFRYDGSRYQQVSEKASHLKKRGK